MASIIRINQPGSRGGLLPGLLAAALCALMMPGCTRDPQARKQKFFDQGLDYLKKGDSRRAALQLSNALQIDPKFAEAADVLAEIRFREGDYRSAYLLLQRIIAAKPDYLPAHKGLSQFYRLSGKLAEAEKEAEFVLEQSPDDIEALMNLAFVQAQQKKPAEAEGTFNHVLEIQPGHIGALEGLALLKKNGGDLMTAERYLKLAVEKNPRSVPARLELIRFYITTGRVADAEPLFLQGQINKDDVRILEAQAGYYEGLKRFSEAEAVVKKIQASRSADPKYRAVLADFYVRVNNWRKAKAELERLHQQHPENADMLHKLIEANFTVNDRTTAESLNEGLLKKNPKDSHGHVFKGRVYLADGQVDRAMLEFAEALKYAPNFVGLHYWLAQGHIKKGELQQARQELDNALRDDPNFREARLTLARLGNSTGAVDDALAQSMTLVKRQPSDTEALLIYGEALIRKNDFARARKVVNTILELAPADWEAHRLSGLLYLDAKNLGEARKEFLQAWNLQPQSKPLLENVILGYFAAKQPDGAIEFLQSTIKNRPGDPLLYLELGQVYLRQKNAAAAISALQKALSLAPADPDITLLLADTSINEKKPERAAQLIAEAIEKHPKDAGLIFRAGMVYEKLQRWDDARKAYERDLQLDGDNALAKNNLAWVLAEHGGNIDVALSLAQQAKEKLSNDIQITDTIGWIYFKKGVYKTARDYLKQCATQDQQNATFQFQLGMAEWRLGNRPEARGALRKALSLDPNSPEAPMARLALAQL